MKKIVRLVLLIATVLLIFKIGIHAEFLQSLINSLEIHYLEIPSSEILEFSLVFLELSILILVARWTISQNLKYLRKYILIGLLLGGVFSLFIANITPFVIIAPVFFFWGSFLAGLKN